MKSMLVWRTRAFLLLAGLAWGATGMVVLGVLDLAVGGLVRWLGGPSAPLAAPAHLPGAAWSVPGAVGGWLLSRGLEMVVRIAMAHPRLASSIEPLLASSVESLRAGPAIPPALLAALLTAGLVRLLGRR